MNLFGPHIHKPGMGLDLLERWKPSAALAMDVDSDYVRQVRQKSPGTVLVVRVYEDGANFLDWPPHVWVDRLLAKFPTDKPGYFVTINEPLGHDSRELFERFDIWESEVIRLLQAAGTDGLACNFGTGNFTAGSNRVKIPDVFPRICAVANAMGPHDYSWPDLQSGWSWYAGRWFQWYDDILAATGKEMKFLIGECGLTQAIIQGRPDHGWQSGGPEGVTAESYLATLHWYLEQVVNWDSGRGIVLGLCLFNFYDQFHWSFEHINKPKVMDAIMAMDVPSPEPPEPPNGGDPMVEIYDFDNSPFDPNATTRDWPWLRSIFGPDLQVHPIEEKADVNLQPGDIIYKVQYLDCKVGETSVVIHVEDINGNPEQGRLPVFGWPSAESHGLPQTWKFWTDNGVHGPTNVNGDVGPSMGTGAYYDWTEIDPETGELGRGPHFVWVWDLPSDYVDGIGMLTWHPDVEGNHLHVNIGYRAEVYMGEEPPKPPDGDLLEVAKDIRAYAADATILLADIKAILLKTPPEPPVDQPFRGEYFNNKDLGGEPAFTRDDEEINFSWADGGPGGGVNPDQFSVRWTGSFTFEAGDYTFYALVDDGIRLWVDGELIIDAWWDQSPTMYEATITLAVGKHDIDVGYYESAGGATCKVWWEKL